MIFLEIVVVITITFGIQVALQHTLVIEAKHANILCISLLMIMSVNVKNAQEKSKERQD